MVHLCKLSGVSCTSHLCLVLCTLVQCCWALSMRHDTAPACCECYSSLCGELLSANLLVKASDKSSSMSL